MGFAPERIRDSQLKIVQLPDCNETLFSVVTAKIGHHQKPDLQKS